ncbi:MAG TPA: capsular biosynthesis protein, partial [Lachnospiraceae bacterium]|nr:capsular biosynthesis protein [Lachnospiraceae bacterium]
EESERIININVKDEDPNQAKAIVDEIARVASDYIENKMDQDAPSIILNGYADGKKVSPNNTRNTILGALLGFVLACAIVIVSFMMNDTIMTNEDVEKKLGINVLGALPLTAGEEEADKIAQKENKKRKKKKKKNKNGEEA